MSGRDGSSAGQMLLAQAQCDGLTPPSGVGIGISLITRTGPGVFVCALDEPFDSNQYQVEATLIGGAALLIRAVKANGSFTVNIANIAAAPTDSPFDVRVYRLNGGSIQGV